MRTQIETTLPPDPILSPTYRLDVMGVTGEILASQHVKDRDFTPGQRLMQAILEQAIHEYRLYSRQHTKRSIRLAEDVLRWFRDPDEKWIYSYRHICLVLGYAHDQLLTGILSGGPETERVGFRRPRDTRPRQIPVIS